MKYPNLDEAFLSVINDHIAGDPMNELIRWIKLTRAGISKLLMEAGFTVSRNIVKRLLKKHGFVKRKMERKISIGTSVHRTEQFSIVTAKKEQFLASGNPVISIDTKKKELLGNLHREGHVYTTKAIEVYDHDYKHLATSKIVPHGIYDIRLNIGYINIGNSNETAEFICDSLQNWWENYGKANYPNATEILILCDAGGANCYRHHIFKAELQNLVNNINISIQVAHYPPYTSKWNPIEHRVFPHVTKSMSGVPIYTETQAAEIIGKTKTSTGLSVVANVLKNQYEKCKKVTKEVLESLNIIKDEQLPQFNYKVMPQVVEC